jgi:DNA mismatch endonuclease, patch repair protein
MKKIKSCNSKAETLLRKRLWEQGYRYRISNIAIKGKPDIVFKKKKLAIFVDGDFWHGYDWSNRKMKLKSNLKYWIPKIERNMQRDLEVTSFLKLQGWKVIRFWEHEVLKGVDHCVIRITKTLK